MSAEAAAVDLQDHAALWSMGEICATDVVTRACDALVDGVDSPALRMPAACTRAESDDDVRDLLPQALDELGLTSTQWAALRDGKPPHEQALLFAQHRRVTPELTDPLT